MSSVRNLEDSGLPVWQRAAQSCAACPGRLPPGSSSCELASPCETS
jgi:hypothetical protein